MKELKDIEPLKDNFGHLNSAYVKNIENLEDGLKTLGEKMNKLKELEVELFPVKQWTAEDEKFAALMKIEESYLANLKKYNERFKDAVHKLNVLLNHIEKYL